LNIAGKKSTLNLPTSKKEVYLSSLKEATVGTSISLLRQIIQT
jgi:hypothetical protein